MFNAEAYIRSALESILNQTYKNIEIIVVDDGSTDNSKNIVLSYGPKVKYVVCPNSGGYPSKVRNTGILHSSGELITFFDADDIMSPHKIEVQVDFLMKYPHISIVLTDYLNFTDSGDYVMTHFSTCNKLLVLIDKSSEGDSFILDSETARTILTTENFASSNSPLLRSELFNDIGMFDEELIIGEDIEFTYRSAMKYNVGILNIVGFKRRLHENNISRNSIKMLIEKLKSRQKLLRLENNSHIRRKIKRFISNIHLALSDNLIGIDNNLALWHLCKSIYFDPLRYVQIKKIAKISLSSIGVLSQKKV